MISYIFLYLSAKQTWRSWCCLFVRSLAVWIEWPSDWVTKWLSDWITKWLNDKVTQWPRDWMTEWPSDWMTKCLNDQMTKWLGDRMTGSFADYWLYGIFYYDPQSLLTKLTIGKYAVSVFILKIISSVWSVDTNHLWYTSANILQKDPNVWIFFLVWSRYNFL